MKHLHATEQIHPWSESSHTQIQVTEEILIPSAKAKGASKLSSGSRTHTKHSLWSQGSTSLTIISTLAVRCAGTGTLHEIQSAWAGLQRHQQIAQTTLQAVRILSAAAVLYA